MSDSLGVEGVALERLRDVVAQRRNEAAGWRAFLVAQVDIGSTQRRRRMTTQRLFMFARRK